MKTKLSTTCFATGTLLTPDAVRPVEEGADHAPASRTAVRGSAITTHIRIRLADEMTSRLMLVQVATDRKGTVVLRGKVRTPEEAARAVSIARAQEGVTSVENNIQIRQ